MKRIFALCLALCCTLAFGYDFIVLGDTHYDSLDVRLNPEGLKKQYQKDEMLRNLTRWHAAIPALLDEVAARSARDIAFAVQLGDIIQGDCGSGPLQARSYQQATERICRGMQCPVYFVKGNHDVRGEGAEEAYQRWMIPFMERGYGMKAYAGGANFTMEVEGDLFIVFDCMKPNLNFVRKALAEHPHCRNLFFLTHFPVMPCTKNPADVIWGRKGDERQRRELWDMLASRNAIVLCAHTHSPTLFQYKFREGRISQLVTFSMPTVEMPPWKEIREDKEQRYFSEEHLGEKTLEQENVQAIKEDCRKALERYSYFQPKGGYVVIHVDGGRVEASLHYGPGAPHRYLLKEAPKPPVPPQGGPHHHHDGPPHHGAPQGGPQPPHRP